jgi:hypothetical protein
LPSRHNYPEKVCSQHPIWAFCFREAFYFITMAENKKSFLLYSDTYHTVKKLADDQAGKLFKTILSYVNDENPVIDDIIIELVFEPIKQYLKRDLRKYELIREKRSQAGKASADKRQQVSTSVESVQQKQQVSTNSTVSDSVNVSVNDNVIVKEEKKKRVKKVFTPPSLSDVRLYFQQNGYKDQTAVKMFNSYSVADWFDSQGKPILNWKQKAINVWFKDENKINGSPQPEKQTYIPKITVITNDTEIQ